MSTPSLKTNQGQTIANLESAVAQGVGALDGVHHGVGDAPLAQHVPAIVRGMFGVGDAPRA